MPAPLPWRRITGLLLLLLLCALTGVLLARRPGMATALATAAHTLGWGAVVPGALLFATASLVGIPGTVLVAATVALLGLARGLAACWSGALAAAAVAFLLARAIGRQRVEHWLARRERLRRLDLAVARRGAATVLLLRIVPSLPFTVLNYLLGLTSVPFSSYLAATALGIVPSTLVYGLAAHEAWQAAESGRWGNTELLAAALLLVAFLALAAAAGRLLPERLRSRARR